MKLKTLLIVGLTLMMSATMAIGLVGCGVKLEAVPAKEATCEYEGNTAYWKDPETGKCYSDEEGKNEIAESDTVIAPTGHSYADTWSSDGTNHWHQATCEHSDKLKDRAEHTYPLWQDKYTELVTNGGKTMTGKEILACTVCGYERPMTEAYQMFICGNISSYPTAKWNNSFKTKADLAANCIPMTYDEATNTFSAEVLLNPRDEFCVYNNAEGTVYPPRASQSSTSALRVEKRSTYIISWQPTDYTVDYSTEHAHKFTSNWKFSATEHWLECDSNDGAIKEGSQTAHQMENNACTVCGFGPDTCEHTDGYSFNYAGWEGATPPPAPEAEGGKLEKVCPYCFGKEEVPYDIGVSEVSSTATEPMDADKTYYFKGKTCDYIGLHFTEAGTYTLTLENVCYGSSQQDRVLHRTLTGIAYSTKKMPSGATLTATGNEKSNNTKGIIWYYNTDGNWLTYSDTYAEMKAAVEKWKAQIVINGDPNYHYDKEVGMVDLTSIKFTVTADDVGDTGFYILIRLTTAISMGAAATENNAYLAKLTKEAPSAPAAAKAQEVALLPEKKTLA